MTAQEPAKAVLVFEDGTVFEGNAYAAVGRALGTVRVHTAPTGYQEVLTSDASDATIVLFTNPHIGNTGVNEEDTTTPTVHAEGIIVRDPARRVSNFRATDTLDTLLSSAGVVGISNVDTRAIAQKVSQTNDVRVGIFSGPNADLPVAELTNTVKHA